MERAKFTFGIMSIFQQGSNWKDHARMKFNFTGGFVHVSEATFTMCGNINKLFQQITHRN